MIERVKQNWHEFKQSKPGHRFQDRYDRRQRDSHGQWNMRSLINIVLGIVIAVAGLALVPAPGPGWIVAFLGLGLLGSEFAPLARGLDWVELKARAVVGWAKGLWDESSGLVKGLIVLVGLAFVAALGYGGYRLLIG